MAKGPAAQSTQVWKEKEKSLKPVVVIITAVALSSLSSSVKRRRSPRNRSFVCHTLYYRTYLRSVDRDFFFFFLLNNQLFLAGLRCDTTHYISTRLDSTGQE